MDAVMPIIEEPATMDAATPTGSSLPTVRDVAQGLGGLLALGTAGALGAHGLTPHAMPGVLWTSAGALVLTGPALLVVHQFLGLQAAPDRVVGSMAWALAKAGQLAMGLVPFQVFFSVTTQRGPGLLALLLCGLGGTGLLAAMRGLVDAERDAGSTGTQLMHVRGLALAWAALTLLVGLRLGWEVMA